jgi:carbonic anhydrase/acetyltransferase-like protein (isoleucine patch superfamily)
LIGEDVLIGHMAMIHGCTIHDRGFVGLSTTVMNACVIESDGMLAAGALLTPGKRIGARQLWSGRPATFMRDLTDAALADMQQGVAHYVANARAHARALADGGR